MLDIHTMELMVTIDKDEYHKIHNIIYALAVERSRTTYQTMPREHRCNYWSDRGVLVYLQKYQYGTKQNKGRLILRVNPSRCLGKKDPLALFLATRENVARVRTVLKDVMDTLLPQMGVQKLRLMRLDLCHDITIPEQYVKTYIRLLQLGGYRYGATEQRFEDERESRSFRSIHNSGMWQLTVYDKLYQLQDQGYQLWKEPAQNLLRVELGLWPHGELLQTLGKQSEYVFDRWEDAITYLAENGVEIMMLHMKRVVPDASYYTLQAAAKKMDTTGYQKRRKRNMIEFLEWINRRKQRDLYTIKQLPSGKRRVRQLLEVGINPVTIGARHHCAEVLPSLQQLFQWSVQRTEPQENLYESPSSTVYYFPEDGQYCN